MSQFHLLAVDDDNLVLQSLRIALAGQWQMTGVNTLKDVPDQKYQAAFVDMHLTNNLEKAEGIDVINALRKKDPHLEIVAMSGDLNRDLMERCLKAGASRFLAKPLSIDELQITLDKIEAYILLQDAAQRSSMHSTPLIGKSRHIQEVKKQAAELKGEPGPILIEGESGTGKEVISHLLHAQEPECPFIRVNIAAIPETLFESEFFGHVKGAFTGADNNKMGLAEAAHGGDLFLDEIEALSLPLQVKLLRFMESGEVRRVGSDKSIHVDVRVLIATNRNLDEMVAKGEFREDLLWRIQGKKILLPPLRERPEDIQSLAEYFLDQDKIRSKQLSKDAVEAFLAHDWPGNVRELKRVCEKLVLQAPLPIIRSEDFQNAVYHKKLQAQEPEPINYSLGLVELVSDYEKKIINHCLSDQKDLGKACKLLKVSRSSLYKKIKDYNIDWRD